jgi:hypothetical protein
VADGRKHTAEEEQIAGLYGLDIGAERSGRSREFGAELRCPRPVWSSYRAFYLGSGEIVVKVDLLD